MFHFDPTHGELAASWEHPETLYALGHDRAGGKLYAGGSDLAIYELGLTSASEGTEDRDGEQPTPVERWRSHAGYVSSMAVLEGTVVSGGYDRRLIWTRAEDGRQQHAVTAHDGWVRDLAAFPDGGRLASVGDDMRLNVWDAQSARRLASFDGHAAETPQGYLSALYAVAVSPDGRHLASADRIGDVCVRDVESGKLVSRLKAPAFFTYDRQKRARALGGIRSLAFAPDGERLALSGIGAVTNVDGFVGPCRVEVWDWQAGRRLFVGQDPHNAILNRVMFHPDDPRWLIAAGGGDSGGVLAFWNQTDEKPAHKLKPKGHIQDFRLDGTDLYAVGHGGWQHWTFHPKPAEEPAEEAASDGSNG